jgi:acyl-CoA reductase-like NAD-dependent aldehyde dehydrogenase
MTEQITSFVAGSWRPAGEGWQVTNPATGEPVADVTRATAEDLDTAAATARETWAWSRYAPVADRVGWCERVARVLEDRAGSLARELSEEHGKPLSEATGEIAAGIRGFRLAAEEALRLEGRVIPAMDPNKRVLAVRQPRGVWAVLTPWNFPFNIPIEYLGPALATGSPVIWKPAPSTPRIAARLLTAMRDAELPEGLVQLLLADGVELASRLTTHPAVDAVGLTGGSATGRAVARAAWDKHLLLELGGNGPVIVLDDADLDAAAKAVASSAFTNAGQVCSAAGRVLVSEGAADELVAGVAALARELVVGDPFAPDTTMGPVHQSGVAERTLRHARDAVGQGARLVSGGALVDDAPTPLFVQPTVLDHVPLAAEVATQETFGPIAPVIRLADDEAILAAANAGGLGLISAVFTQSISRAWWFAERLETGSVVVNDQSNYWELHLPFGGRAGKDSGRGRLGGACTLEEFTQIKVISMDVR